MEVGIVNELGNYKPSYPPFSWYNYHWGRQGRKKVDMSEVEGLFYGLRENSVEKLIYQCDYGEWMAVFAIDRLVRVEVRYCPWCGKDLRIVGAHNHTCK